MTRPLRHPVPDTLRGDGREMQIAALGIENTGKVGGRIDEGAIKIEEQGSCHHASWERRLATM